jgi:transcriptional regulator with GAF, ATPase, and Fis domain
MRTQLLQETGDNAQPIEVLAASRATTEKKSFNERVWEFERGIIAEALAEAGGSVTRAARALQLTHQGLCYIINHRHKELLAERAPIRIRRRSIMFKSKRRQRKRTASKHLNEGLAS